MEEVIAPKIFEHHETIQTPQENLAEEIKRLRNRCSLLEQTVQTLASEITQLKSIRPDQLAKVENIKTVHDDLPSFLKDNPWVDVLSKRGKEPERYIS
jgi:predicted nuclease with TOPRIM domain